MPLTEQERDTLPLTSGIYPPPRLGQRYGLVPLLGNPPAPLGDTSAYVPALEGVYSHPEAHKIEPQPVVGPDEEHQGEAGTAVRADRELVADPFVGATPGDWFTLHGLLLNLIDSVRALYAREPVYTQISVQNGVPYYLHRQDRKHLLLWWPSAAPPALTLSGVVPTANLTPKVGWNVLDVPDGTAIALQNPGTAVVAMIACVDEVPPGLLSN